MYTSLSLNMQVTAEWLRPSAWMDQSGTPQPSLDSAAAPAEAEFRNIPF